MSDEITNQSDCISPDNNSIWNEVCISEYEETKEVFDGRRKFTSIDAYHQIKKATNLWGPYGLNWGLINEQVLLIREEKMCLFLAKFKYPYEGTIVEFETGSTIKVVSNNGTPDQDFLKKVRTDTLTKALSFLGFNADVFLGKFDDNKYVEELKQQKLERDKKEAYNKELINAINENSKTIKFIKENLDNNISAASQAWFELDNDTKVTLWAQPDKGGPFSIKEKKIMQTKEFKEAKNKVRETIQ